MKGIAGWVVGAVGLAVLGGVCLGASRVDRRLAAAQQALLTADYDAADASLQEVERYYEYVRHVPWVGARAFNELRARRAAVDYWRRQYSVLAPADRTDPVSDVSADNIALQLIVADSVYRNGQSRATDRAAQLRLLEAALDAYRSVLSNARRPEDAPYSETAAYNYEYVVRLRGEVVSARRRALPVPRDDRTFGAEGKPEDPTFENEFKQYVPLEKEERENAEPGKQPPPVRKG